MDCKFKTKQLRINQLSGHDRTSLNQHKIQVFPNLPFPNISLFSHSILRPYHILYCDVSSYHVT